MTPKEAVSKAKDYFLDIIGEEPTLEEIWFDDSAGNWCVTFGLRRRSPGAPGTLMGTVNFKEVIDYKVVRLRETDGSFVSILNRESRQAA